MQWTIKLEITPDGGGTISHEIGTITRPIGDLKSEEIGLTLAEGHELVRDIERRMISDQIHIYMFCFRRCTNCGQRQPFKDVRTKCVLTMFGPVELFRSERPQTRSTSSTYSRATSVEMFRAGCHSVSECALEQQVRCFRLPSHLLLLHKPAADHLIDGRFGDRGRNRLSVSATIAIVRDEVAIGFQVVIQFARQLAPFE